MMTLLVMPSSDVSSYAAIRLVIGLELTGVLDGLFSIEIEATIFLVVGPGLTGAWLTNILKFVSLRWGNASQYSICLHMNAMSLTFV